MRLRPAKQEKPTTQTKRGARRAQRAAQRPPKQETAPARSAEPVEAPTPLHLRLPFWSPPRPSCVVTSPLRMAVSGLGGRCGSETTASAAPTAKNCCWPASNACRAHLKAFIGVRCVTACRCAVGPGLSSPSRRGTSPGSGKIKRLSRLSLESKRVKGFTNLLGKPPPSR